MTIFQEIGAWFSALPAQLRLLSWTDILDVAILTVVYYWIYRCVRERRGGRLLIGLGVLVVTMTVSAVLQIHAVSYILLIPANMQKGASIMAATLSIFSSLRLL